MTIRLIIIAKIVDYIVVFRIHYLSINRISHKNSLSQ